MMMVKIELEPCVIEVRENTPQCSPKTPCSVVPKKSCLRGSFLGSLLQRLRCLGSTVGFNIFVCISAPDAARKEGHHRGQIWGPSVRMEYIYIPLPTLRAQIAKTRFFCLWCSFCWFSRPNTRHPASVFPLEPGQEEGSWPWIVQGFS